MHDLEQIIQASIEQLQQELQSASSTDNIRDIHINFLGRKGILVNLNNQLKDLPIEEKRLYGPKIQLLRSTIEAALQEKLSEISAYTTSKENIPQSFDVTASLYQATGASLHIYSLVLEELEDIFISMGFEIITSPEVEHTMYNFDALNMPANHPARDAHDTFWLSQLPGMLLRTHTSNAQIHAMKSHKPPLAAFCAGRVFRNEATDASHEFMFM